MGVPGTARIVADVPIALRDRVKRVSKHLFLPIQHLVREGLERRCDEFDARQRAEEEQRKREESEKRNRPKRPRGRPRIYALDPPDAPSTEPEQIIEPDSIPDEAEPIYKEHAARILSHLNNPVEKRIRVVEAIKAVQERFPLTHPSEGEIMQRLERHLMELRREQQAQQPVGPFTAAMAAPVAQPVAETMQTLGSLVGDRIDRALDNLTGKTVDVSRVSSHGDMPTNEENENA